MSPVFISQMMSHKQQLDAKKERRNHEWPAKDLAPEDDPHTHKCTMFKGHSTKSHMCICTARKLIK